MKVVGPRVGLVETHQGVASAAKSGTSGLQDTGWRELGEEDERFTLGQPARHRKPGRRKQDRRQFTLGVERVRVTFQRGRALRGWGGK